MKKNKPESGTSIFQDEDGDDDEEEISTEASNMLEEKRSNSSGFMPLELESSSNQVASNTPENPLIDIEREIFHGNFEPLFLALKYNLIDKNFIDSMGFNFLHQAASHDCHCKEIYFLPL
jgi:hypothetical protein